jgi:hypothetical protein
MPSDAELSGRINHGGIDLMQQRRRSPSEQLVMETISDLPPYTSGEGTNWCKENPKAGVQEDTVKSPTETVKSPTDLVVPVMLDTENKSLKGAPPAFMWRTPEEPPQLKTPDSGLPFSLSLMNNPERDTRSMAGSIYSRGTSSMSLSPLPELQKLGSPPPVPAPAYQPPADPSRPDSWTTGARDIMGKRSPKHKREASS